jgi:hypothetical protein
MRSRLAFIFLLVPFLFFGSAYPSSSEAFTSASLKTMLDNMGYESTEGKFNDDSLYYQVNFVGTNWSYVSTIHLSSNGRLYAYLDFGLYTGETKDIPIDIALSLLQENQGKQNVHFEFLIDSKKFRLLGSLPIQNASPVALRQLLEELVKTAEKSEKLWNPKLWPAVEKPQAEPAVKTVVDSPESATPGIASDSKALGGLSDDQCVKKVDEVIANKQKNATNFKRLVEGDFTRKMIFDGSNVDLACFDNLVVVVVYFNDAGKDNANQELQSFLKEF